MNTIDIQNTDFTTWVHPIAIKIHFGSLASFQQRPPPPPLSSQTLPWDSIFTTLGEQCWISDILPSEWNFYALWNWDYAMGIMRPFVHLWQWHIFLVWHCGVGADDKVYFDEYYDSKNTWQMHHKLSLLKLEFSTFYIKMITFVWSKYKATWWKNITKQHLEWTQMILEDT